ncbi:MAG: nicotinate-nucleotide--dimethylbenzimidazole phosphoribosyltransferase [Halomonas sp.]|nr:nicotinate-nucleotide--dimethylbenzimidazole phosphoribosyltransferase [Halomonas sp.]
MPPDVALSMIERIAPVDACAGERTRAYLDTLTKPPGSLGQLETLAIQLSSITGELRPRVTPPSVLVFAADHGVAAESVSAFPQAVTAQMVANFARGGAAINVFARQIGAQVEIVDVGVASKLTMPGVTHAKVRQGTANMAIENAMQSEEAKAAIEAGKVGGLEIAAMVGAYLAAAANRLPAIVDGFIATVAALVACRLCPAVRGYLVFGHRSEEPGHAMALEALDAQPLLALGMRLGEGSGAALAFPLLQAAAGMLNEMATFADAGVSDNTSQ